MNQAAYVRGVMSSTATAMADCLVTLSPPSSAATSSGVSPLTPGGVVDLRLAVAAPVGATEVLVSNLDGIQGAMAPGTVFTFLPGIQQLTATASWKKAANLYISFTPALGAAYGAGSAVNIVGPEPAVTVPAEILSSKSFPAGPDGENVAWGVSIARELLAAMPGVGWPVERVDDAGDRLTGSVAIVENRDTDVFVFVNREVRR